MSGDQPRSIWDLIFEEIENGSDRVAVIIVAAILDDGLEQLLSTFMVEEGTSANTLLKGALQSFSSRVLLAQALGLITSNQAADLKLIGKIRNDFAHQAEVFDFSHEVTAQRCRQLYIPNQGTMPDRDPTPRARFLHAFAMLAYAISNISIPYASKHRRTPPLRPDIQNELARTAVP